MNEKLAINGGTPVRNRPLPQEWCGAHYMDEQECDAAARVCRSKTLFRYYGMDLQNEVSQLEKEFAAYIGVGYALAVSSGTSALQVSLGALGIGPGDEVLVPGYFWVATVGAVVRSGAIPVLVDCDDTFDMDPKDAARKITPRTQAILVVHMGGVIGKIKEIVTLARQHNLKVVEDCAQASGASQNGIKAGAFGDLGIFSFQMNKHMTSGEGGMVVTRNEGLYRRAFAIHDLGYPRNDAGRLVMDDPALQLWGIGCRMSELTGAVRNDFSAIAAPTMRRTLSAVMASVKLQPLAARAEIASSPVPTMTTLSGSPSPLPSALLVQQGNSRRRARNWSRSRSG